MIKEIVTGSVAAGILLAGCGEPYHRGPDRFGNNMRLRGVPVSCQEGAPTIDYTSWSYGHGFREVQSTITGIAGKDSPDGKPRVSVNLYFDVNREWCHGASLIVDAEDPRIFRDFRGDPSIVAALQAHVYLRTVDLRQDPATNEAVADVRVFSYRDLDTTQLQAREIVRRTLRGPRSRFENVSQHTFLPYFREVTVDELVQLDPEPGKVAIIVPEISLSYPPTQRTDGALV